MGLFYPLQEDLNLAIAISIITKKQQFREKGIFVSCDDIIDNCLLQYNELETNTDLYPDTQEQSILEESSLGVANNGNDSIDVTDSSKTNSSQKRHNEDNVFSSRTTDLKRPKIDQPVATKSFIETEVGEGGKNKEGGKVITKENDEICEGHPSSVTSLPPNSEESRTDELEITYLTNLTICDNQGESDTDYEDEALVVKPTTLSAITTTNNIDNVTSSKDSILKDSSTKVLSNSKSNGVKTSNSSSRSKVEKRKPVGKSLQACLKGFKLLKINYNDEKSINAFKIENVSFSFASFTQSDIMELAKLLKFSLKFENSSKNLKLLKIISDIFQNLPLSLFQNYHFVQSRSSTNYRNAFFRSLGASFCDILVNEPNFNKKVSFKFKIMIKIYTCVFEKYLEIHEKNQNGKHDNSTVSVGLDTCCKQIEKMEFLIEICISMILKDSGRYEKIMANLNSRQRFHELFKEQDMMNKIDPQCERFEKQIKSGTNTIDNKNIYYLVFYKVVMIKTLTRIFHDKGITFSYRCDKYRSVDYIMNRVRQNLLSYLLVLEDEDLLLLYMDINWCSTEEW